MAVSPHTARLIAEGLAAFIIGVGIATGLGWAFRDKIRAAVLRRRGEKLEARTAHETQMPGARGIRVRA